jgi:hypothetical protein
LKKSLKKALKIAGGMIATPLGKWGTGEAWRFKWFYSPEENKLYERGDNEEWFTFQANQARRTRHTMKRFGMDTRARSETIPTGLQIATVAEVRSIILMTGTAKNDAAEAQANEDMDLQGTIQAVCEDAQWAVERDDSTAARRERNSRGHPRRLL